MPFLRFARDSRGYESTFLMDASRRRGGKTRQRILYWFRSPPNVKVGRAALDEDAIRWIEEHNPDVTFDWPRILEVEPPSPKASASRDVTRSGVGPPAPAPAADPRRRRPREQRQQRQQRQQRERPGGREAAKDGGQRRREGAPPPPPQTLESQAEEAIEQMEMEQIEQDTDDLNPDAGPGVPLISEAREPEAARPAVEAAITKILSKEQLMSFRARFAELQARIMERAGSPERIGALRAQAEGLNPDTWVTEDEVRKGMAEFEPQVRDLRAALGLRRRRRSRRGGHGHRRAGGETQPQGTLGEKRDGGIFPGPAGQETPSPNGEDDV